MTNEINIGKNLTERRQQATPKGVGIAFGDIYVDHAKNAEVWDVNGKRYIDFAGGIGVLNTGHLHPKVVAAVTEQLNKFSHTCYMVLPYENFISAAEKMNTRAPIAGAVKTVFLTSGAEAVENAVKIARSFTGRRGVISFFGGYHGRTNLTLAMTAKVKPYKVGFGPFVGDIYHSPYPNIVHGISVEDAVKELHKLFQSTILPSDVAAIVIEPIQGEGGFNVTPPEFMQALREICDEHGIVLIFDEVQTGFARTGKFFASEHYSVQPDMITIAKSMAGGFPISGVTGKAEIMDAPDAGGLGGTYAGSPIGLAAVHAVIEVIEEENLCARAESLGNKLVAQLKTMQNVIPQIREVRGLGGMVAVEFFDKMGKETNPKFAKTVQQHAKENGLILLTCGMDGNVIRFLFPLTIEDNVFDEALQILIAAIEYANKLDLG